MEDNAALYLVDARDGVAFLVSLRIAAGDKHDADGCTLVKLYLVLIEVALSHTFEQVDDVALQAQHDGLGLWVAHAAVVFNNVRLWFCAGRIGAINQSEEDKTFVVNAFGSQSFDGRTDDAVFDLLHPFLRGKGNG